MLRKFWMLVLVGTLALAACAGPVPAGSQPASSTQAVQEQNADLVPVETDVPAYPGPDSTAPSGGDVVKDPNAIELMPQPEGELQSQGPLTEYWKPQPQDDQLVRGNAFVESSQMMISESDASAAPQFMLHLQGILPTPCNKLRIEVTPAEGKNRFDLEVYSLVDPGQMCTQVLSPFMADVPLEGFDPATDAIYVNGKAMESGL